MLSADLGMESMLLLWSGSSLLFFVVVVVVAVINITESSLGRKGFVSFFTLRSNIKGSQDRT